MKVILEGADFSANNIGTIVIPVVLESETLAILSKTTRYGEDSAQTLALNRFIKALKTSGVWEKIALFVPTFMGKSVQEVAYDAISDSYLQWYHNVEPDYDETNHALGAPSSAENYVTRALTPQLKVADNFHLHFCSSNAAINNYSYNKCGVSCCSWFNQRSGVNVGTFNLNKNYYATTTLRNDFGGLLNLVTGVPVGDGSKYYTIDGDGVLFEESLAKSATYDVSVNDDITTYPLIDNIYIGNPRNNSQWSLKQEFHIIGNAALTESEALATIAAARALYDELA